ncbi:MAG: FIST N-terminal domain-containing protein [Isosphaeraceae bacterium]
MWNEERMAMKCVSALSTLSDSTAALDDVLARVRPAFGGEAGGPSASDLAILFGSAHHAPAFGVIARTIRESGLARVVVGCTAESIVGDGLEVEGEPALALWAARLPGVTLRPFRLDYDGSEVQGGEGLAEGPEGRSLLLLADPFSFPTDVYLKELRTRAPALPVFGGMASASRTPRGNRIILGGEVYQDGAVAVEISGALRVRTVVSQGCRPIGRPMIVTRAERNIIREIGRRPALEVLRETFEGLSPEDQELVQEGLHIGRVINEYQESFHRGDFLVRNVLGADDSGGIAITDVIRVGQTIQFHVRDAASADEDLLSLLERDRQSRPDSKVVGGLLFTCNGRGTRLFPGPNHDAEMIQRLYGPMPVAGFFAMGEIGPVGGQNFVHGYTASLALFERPAPE